MALVLPIDTGAEFPISITGSQSITGRCIDPSHPRTCRAPGSSRALPRNLDSARLLTSKRSLQIPPCDRAGCPDAVAADQDRRALGPGASRFASILVGNACWAPQP